MSSPDTVNGADALLGPALALDNLDTPALLSGDREVSYPELAAAVARAGHVLRAKGLDRQQRMLLIVDDRTEFFYAYLGAMKIGAVPIALNLRASAKDIAYIVKDSGAHLIVVDPEFLHLVQEALESLETRDTELPVILTDHRPDSGLEDLATLMPDWCFWD